MIITNAKIAVSSLFSQSLYSAVQLPGCDVWVPKP